MDGNQGNIEYLEDNEKLSSLIDCIYQFSHKLVKATTEREIYQLLVKDLSNQMGIVDFVIFKVNKETKMLKILDSHGNLKLHGIKVLEEDESIRTQIGVSSLDKGHAKINSSEDYENHYKIVSLGSEIIVPIVLNGITSAVIIGKYSNQNALTESHRKLWEAVTSLASGAIIKLRRENELKKIKSKLEGTLERKDEDLGKIIDILSSKNSELKYYNEKQKELLQELHHRVTNNLQTISSIIRLYKYGNQKDSKSALGEIYNRVQILAIIYQNIYKSMEKDCVEVDAFLQDMVSYLKSTSNEITVDFQIISDLRCLSFNVLISLGLFVAEVYYSWLEKADASGTTHIKFNILVEGFYDSKTLIISIKDEGETQIENLINPQSSEYISDIMISGLIDQLEGEIHQGFEDGNFINLQFKP